jgi:hypothetical protein
MYFRPSCLAAHQRIAHIKEIHSHLSARLNMLVMNPPEDFDLNLLQIFIGLR